MEADAKEHGCGWRLAGGRQGFVKEGVGKSEAGERALEEMRKLLKMRGRGREEEGRGD